MRNDYSINRHVERNALSMIAVEEQYICKKSGGQDTYHIVRTTDTLCGKEMSDKFLNLITEEVPEDHVVLIVSKKVAENLRL